MTPATPTRHVVDPRVELLAAIVLLAGCAEVHGGIMDAGAASVAAPSGDAGPPTVALIGEVTEIDFAAAFGEEPLAGVTVCARTRDADLETDPLACTQTDELGRYTLTDLATDADLWLTFVQRDFRPMLWAIHTPARAGEVRVLGLRHPRLSRLAELEVTLVPLNEVREAEGAAPVVLGDQSGALSFGGFEIQQINVGDVNAELDPASGDGPFFVGEDWLIDPGLERTRVGGWGHFYNIDPGEVELIFTRTGAGCRYAAGPTSGWPSESGRDNAALVRIEPGYFTWWTTMECRSDLGDAGAGDDAGTE